MLIRYYRKQLLVISGWLLHSLRSNFQLCVFTVRLLSFFLGSKRDSTYSNGGDGEVMSGFGKEIAKKRNALKSPNQQENLKKIDSNLNERALHSAKSDERGIKKGKVAPGDEIRARERTPKSESMHSKLGRKDEKRKAVCIHVICLQNLICCKSNLLTTW